MTQPIQAAGINEAWCRDIFEQSPLALAMMTGPDHVYTMVSPRYSRLLNDRPLVGHPVREAIPELGEAAFEILDRVFETGCPYTETERSVHLIDQHTGASRECLLNINFQALRDHDGVVQAIVTVAVDVTDQVRTRQQIEAAQIDAERARAEAVAANHAKSAFLATMSHEIRTPINAIQGYTQLMSIGLGGEITPMQRDYLTRLDTSARHLLGIVNDVLDLSKIDAGEMTVSREHAMANDVIAVALDLTRPQAGERGVELIDGMKAAPSSDAMTEADATATSDRGPTFVGDPHRVRQILLNLLSNAVKFTEPGGTITITTGITEEQPPGGLQGDTPWAYVRVTDTGIGIPDRQHSAVFEPFHQVDYGHTRTRGGTGLGLAISRRLARLMNGDLTLESVPGMGSTFTLWLPCATRGMTQPADTPSPIHGLRELGELLKSRLDAIVEAYVDRLRSNTHIRLAKGMRRPELEGHMPSFLADVAQSLIILDSAGQSAQQCVADSTAIQQVVASAHGARRCAQGWVLDELHQEHAILRDVIGRAIGRQPTEIELHGLYATVDRADAIPVPRDGDIALVLFHMMALAEHVSERAWRNAATQVSTPPATTLTPADAPITS